MYLINKDTNVIQEIQNVTFRELGFREREHLQEWIRKNPSCLKEDLLIIQKEFSGFDETNERLDLLALDKSGNLVVIENKLDDTGKDVTWQALKYASYCSSLDSGNIISIFTEYLRNIGSDESAEQLLEEFFESEDFEEILTSATHQRIMLVAGEYRKEVTSTVLWLINNYGLRIQCFKATPFKMEEQEFVNFEQVIPMRDAQEFIIGMAQKNRDNIEKKEQLKNRHHIRKDFWLEMLKEVNKVSGLYSNVSATKDHWISAGSGMSGVVYNCVATKSYVRIELTIYGRSQEENKQIFDLLAEKQEAIDAVFPGELIWEKMEAKRMSRIKFEKQGVSIFNKEDWASMIEFLTTHLPQFEKAFKKPLQQVNQKLKNT